jgi:hypothetical protein
VRTLAQIRRRTTTDAAARLAEIELPLDDDLLARGDGLDATSRAALRRDRAACLAALGRRKEAIDELKSLTRAYPRDGQTQEELAALLAAGDEADLAAAATKWHEVAARSRPGTPRWFRAHLELARTQLRLGQVAAARETIDRVAVGHPDFGGDAMQGKFDDLSREIAEPPARATPTK